MQLGLIFGGIVVSLIVQFLKKRFETNSAGNMVAVVTLAIVGAVGYKLLNHYGMWEAFLQLLTVAGAFYAFIIRNVQETPVLPSTQAPMSINEQING